MKILIISDAWTPQINGVVRTLEATLRELKLLGHSALVIGPEVHRLFTIKVPYYPEIKLEFFAYRRIKKIMQDFMPDFIHIATEGPLGWTTRRLCLHNNKPFTTSYHTRFPEYLAARVPHFLAQSISFITYAVLRRFHAPAAAVMVATPSIEVELRAHKFRHLVRWSRGVDIGLFRPYGKSLVSYNNLPRPILLNVGRIAIEKNLRAFLDLEMLGTKVVIGDGPDLSTLRHAYPHVHFMGSMEGEALARHYAAADLFVFPSITDTFGLVLLEACATGLRIAACPAPGQADIFAHKDSTGFAVLNDNLYTAATQALSLPDRPEVPHAFATHFSWGACTQQFLTHLQSPSPIAVRRIARWRRRIGEGIAGLIIGALYKNKK